MPCRRRRKRRNKRGLRRRRRWKRSSSRNMSRRGAGGIGVGAAGVGAKAGAGAEAVGAARAAAAELKPEQQASHWHGKCNLLCKMKNTRRVEAEHRPRGTAQTDPQRHGVIETDKHTEGSKECAERKREREGERDSHSGNRTMHVIIEPTITAQLADINIIQFLFNSVQQTQ